ncbi:MAG: undecaprenyl-phosphate glucose phosphotransferase [Muribaculaceae bacterium]|nr:undecaprenyl-phosphate glucose phosphotransferase [Muribaculaceae bacterium]MDE6130143.1 undecaprenyl-phosphate glucose phosphotransferase [Muribaculaceae bacterium]
MAIQEVPSKSRYGKYTQSILNFIDLLVINIFFGLTLCTVPGPTPCNTREMWLLLNLAYLPCCLWISRNTHYRRAILMDHVIRQSVATVCMHALFFLALISFLRLEIRPRTALTFYASLLVALPLTWATTRFIIKLLRRRGFNTSSVVIVGINPTSERLLQEIESDPGFGYKVKGFFDDICPDDFKGRHLGTINDLDNYVKENTIHQIFYTYTANTNDDLSKAVKIADDNICDFYYVPRITRFVNRPFTLNTIGSVPVLSARPNPLAKQINRLLKRSFDLAVSSAFLLFYPLIYIPVAIAIKISSPGPVYFKQERTGYRGNSFYCYKFRTMKVNASADNCQATRHDPRKTRVGDFLRKTSLDELPQFINVWKGDMSIVGPRPHMLKHTKEYSELIDRYMVRHMVKPGITGWAQVNGYRGLTDELWKMERRVEFDTWYIENWTFFLDLKIMVRTVINAIKGESNAF